MPEQPETTVEPRYERAYSGLMNRGVPMWRHSCGHVEPLTEEQRAGIGGGCDVCESGSDDPADWRPLYIGTPEADGAGVVVEHAQLMAGGDMHVRNTDPGIERIFPLEQWIAAGQRFGGRVFRRTVRVVEDWTEIPRTVDEAGERDG